MNIPLPIDERERIARQHGVTVPENMTVTLVKAGVSAPQYSQTYRWCERRNGLVSTDQDAAKRRFVQGSWRLFIAKRNAERKAEVAAVSEKVKHFHAMGLRNVEIAREVGRSPAVVAKYLSNLGLIRNAPAADTSALDALAALSERVRAMTDDGMYCGAIAERLGVTPQMVVRAAKFGGFRTKRKPK